MGEKIQFSCHAMHNVLDNDNEQGQGVQPCKRSMWWYHHVSPSMQLYLEMIYNH